MDHFEMVEKLRQKANVSYEEAKAALETSDWDILDALVLLESEGKVKKDAGAAEYTTQEKPVEETARPEGRNEFREGIRKLGCFLRTVFQKGNANSFVVTRRKDELVSMPVTVLVLLLICCWPFSLIVLVVGLFVGLRYSFRGPDMNGSKMNDAMNKAADAVQGDDENTVK